MRRDRPPPPPQPPDPADLLDHARRWLHDTVDPVASRWPLIAVALAALVAVAVLLPRWRARRLARHARVVTIGAPPTADPDGALLLWSSLHALLRSRAGRLLRGNVHLAWEIAADDDGARFRMWVPRTIPTGLLERTVTAAWPGATLDDGDDGSAATLEDGRRRVLELLPTGPDWFPIGTGTPDPLPLVLGQLADLGPRQRVLVQVLARPATRHERRRLRAIARRLRAGTPRSGWLSLSGQQRAARPAPDPTIAPDVRAVLDKAAHPGYRCLVRITVAAPSRRAAAGRARAVAGAFAAYDGRAGLRSRRRRASLPRVVERRLGHGAFLLSVPELAALAHLPTDETTPGVDRAGARSVPPPPRLPAAGKPLGIASNGRRVMLAAADARHHLHLLGPTGTGKSTLIARLALDDLAAGRGAVVIDPKGDLVEDILARIPADAIDRVDLLDPHDPKPPALNVLEGRDTDLVVDQLVGIFHRLYERSWGPRTDDILRSSLLTLARAGANDARRRAAPADRRRLAREPDRADQRPRRPRTILAVVRRPLGDDARAGDRAGVQQAARAAAAPQPAQHHRTAALDARHHPRARHRPAPALLTAEGHARRGHQPPARVDRRRPRLASRARPRRPAGRATARRRALRGRGPQLPQPADLGR
ncbi:MAG TPA: hypothetical protein VGM91_10325 [Conexibacter sp.]|jgi:hypothetical protein